MMKIRDIPVIRIFVRWIDSANFAVEGILQAARTQRHFKFHLMVAFFVLFGCFMLGVEKHEFIAITLVTFLVIAAELLNSALETIVDLKVGENNDTARIAKDMAAGAVLVCATGALVVGYLILWPYFIRIIREGFWIAKHYPENIAVLAVIVVMLLVIMAKAYFGKGHPLRGGFPSGHSAIVFSLWISVTYLSSYRPLIFGSLALAIIISLSRLQRKIHSIIDISFGALTGSLVTLLLFWIFY
jgi:diacylglycerol kinase (ATP)